MPPDHAPTKPRGSSPARINEEGGPIRSGPGREGGPPPLPPEVETVSIWVVAEVAVTLDPARPYLTEKDVVKIASVNVTRRQFKSLGRKFFEEVVLEKVALMRPWLRPGIWR